MSYSYHPDNGVSALLTRCAGPGHGSEPGALSLKPADEALLLSQIRRGADDGNRTRVASLEDWGSTIELHPRRRRWLGGPINPATGVTRLRIRLVSRHELCAPGAAVSTVLRAAD